MGLKALLVVIISCMIVNVYGLVSSTQPPHHSPVPVKALVHPPAEPPLQDPNTMTLAYWANWRVLLCSIWLSISVGIAIYLIWKYERPLVQRQRISRFQRTHDDVVLFDEDCWHSSWPLIHPSWLMIFRIVCFVCIFVPILINLSGQGNDYFRFYNQWTFLLSSLYFAIASIYSIYGCYQYHYNDGSKRIISMELPEIPVVLNAAEIVVLRNQGRARPAAGFWGYTLQIIYQMQAAAVMLSAFSYWYLNIPRLGTKHPLVEFGPVWMHSFYPFILFLESASNRLKFPFFRIAYFLLWTCAYVVFQWIFHACKNTWWPYFLYDLTSSFAPVWYLIGLILHVPFFGSFWLMLKLKHRLLLRWFQHL